MIAVYGVTCSPVGNGIHDIHMNSGTSEGVSDGCEPSQTDQRYRG
jgi:hypothetical protein